MSRMLHRRGAPATGQKAFLAVAAYQGLGAGFTYALFHTAQELERAGIASELAIYSGNCHVDDSRNRLVRDFLKSDCTDFVSLDADIGWHAKDFVQLLGYDRDVVAGIYPKKHGDDTYPVRLIPGEVWADKDGLIEVEGVPTGFLRIRRRVLEVMAGEAKHYNARNKDDEGTPCIFERQIRDGIRFGGDYVFCLKWREIGGRIYVAPEMRFEHSGEHTWTGSVGAWLRQKNGLGFVRGLNAFAKGTEEPQDAFDLFDAWGNPFAADPLLLLSLGLLARNATGPILELGGGLSSLVMASATKREVHVLEDNAIYADRVREEAERHGLTNLFIHCRPPKQGWYDLTGVPPLEWGMVFVDGPRRTSGSRADAFDRLDLSRAVVVADDVQADGGLPEMRARLEQTHEVRVIGSGRKEFAVGAPRRKMAIAAE